MTKQDPWYIHAGLYFVIVVLVFLLVKVAIIDPTAVVESEKFNKSESRLRMENLKQAEILWQKKHGTYTDNIDSLIIFLKTDPLVDSIRNAYDSLARRPSDPFKPLSHGAFNPESLLYTPKSHQQYIVQVDSSMQLDTVVNRSGKVIRVDSSFVIGNLYYIEDPDGYGTVGSLDDEALKNRGSWE